MSMLSGCYIKTFIPKGHGSESPGVVGVGVGVGGGGYKLSFVL